MWRLRPLSIGVGGPPLLNGIMVQPFEPPTSRPSASHRACTRPSHSSGNERPPRNHRPVRLHSPDRGGWRFAGPHLHVDAQLKVLVPFDTRGLVHPADTADEGAFRGVLGFHRRLGRCPAGDSGRTVPPAPGCQALAPMPISGSGGGSGHRAPGTPSRGSPSRAASPRIVQYVKMAPPLTYRYRDGRALRG
jgi:hypothetical protein